MAGEDAEQGAHDGHAELGADELPRADGADEDVAEVAGVEFLEEGDGDAHLAAQGDLPEQDAAEEGAAGDGCGGVAAADEVARGEAPDAHLQGGPVDELEQAGPAVAVEAEVAVDHAPDAGGAHCAPSSGTASAGVKWGRGGAAAWAGGWVGAWPGAVPRADVEEDLFEVGAAVAGDEVVGGALIHGAALLEHDDGVAEAFDLGHVVACEEDGAVGLGPVALEPGADEVGGVGVEAGGGFVEQEHVGRVDEGFGEGDAGFLAGGELAGGAVEEGVEVELVGEFGDAAVELADGVEVAVDAEVFADGEAGGEGDVRGRRSSCGRGRRSGRAPCRGRGRGWCRPWAGGGRVAW